jgi:hypothetical protein
MQVLHLGLDLYIKFDSITYGFDFNMKLHANIASEALVFI